MQHLPLFLALCLALPLTAQRGTVSVSTLGSVMENNGGTQRFGSHDVEFSNPNSAIGLEIGYRTYSTNRVSLETGLRISSRNFKTTKFGESIFPQPGVIVQQGRVQGGYLTALTIPARVYYGVKPKWRTDKNQNSGLYAGASLQYNLVYKQADLDGIQYAIFRTANRRITPYVLTGFRTNGRLVQLQLEAALPLNKTYRDFNYDGVSHQLKFKEFFLSVGLGHTF